MNITYRNALISCTTDEFLDLCRKGLFDRGQHPEDGPAKEQGLAEFVRQGMVDVVPVYGCVVTPKVHALSPETPAGGQPITATQNCEDGTVDLKYDRGACE